jgi:hypothetical protein
VVSSCRRHPGSPPPLGFGVARNTIGAFLNLTAQISDASFYSIFAHGHSFGSGGNPWSSAEFEPRDLTGRKWRMSAVRLPTQRAERRATDVVRRFLIFAVRNCDHRESRVGWANVRSDGIHAPVHFCDLSPNGRNLPLLCRDQRNSDARRTL